MALAFLFHYLMLHPDTIPPQPNHKITPTHIVPEQYNPWNNSTNKSQAPEDGCIASDIKLVSLYSITTKYIWGFESSWDVRACYGVSLSRRFENTRCPSSIFAARFHVGVTMKIQVVRDVTPGSWVGCSRGFDETCCLLVQSLGSPWRWRHQRLRNVKNH